MDQQQEKKAVISVMPFIDEWVIPSFDKLTAPQFAGLSLACAREAILQGMSPESIAELFVATLAVIEDCQTEQAGRHQSHLPSSMTAVDWTRQSYIDQYHRWWARPL